jgi:predicted dithiol-disulfide oxidoreductase (DUF899 family)
MKNHKIVPTNEWIEARKKGYVFEGANGEETLSELFAGKSQLIVYHFMFDPAWEVGCKSCSFWADSFTTLT